MIGDAEHPNTNTEKPADRAGSGRIPIRRGELSGHATATYIPRRGRGARHYADNFSVALWLCKLDPEKGAEWAHDFAGALVELVPEGTQIIATPPASRRRSAAGWYFARELGAGLARRLGIPLARPLRWERDVGEASKGIVHQAGKGRALGRRVVCDEDLTGLRVCLVDDLFTTGVTLQVCAEALKEAGAEWPPGMVTLGATERTEARPADERERIRERARRKRLRGGGVR